MLKRHMIPLLTPSATENAYSPVRSILFLTCLLNCCNAAIFFRLESDVKRLQADLQASRQIESVLRSELNTMSNEEQRIKLELDQLKRDNESLQTK